MHFEGAFTHIPLELEGILSSTVVCNSGDQIFVSRDQGRFVIVVTRV